MTDLNREQFEVWAKQSGYQLDRCDKKSRIGTADHYRDNATAHAWHVWQAARSAVPAQASAPDADMRAALQKAAKLLRVAGFCMTGTATSQIMAAINAADQVQPQGVPSERVVVAAYRLTVDPDTRIEEARQSSGPSLWAVRKNGNCLNRQGGWEYEPMPSSRDDDFIARCRFMSSDEAILAANSQTQEGLTP